MPKDYIKLKDLEVYKLAREASQDGWKIYETFDWHEKKIAGGQFIRSLDSVGANIAEGYGRFHFLDKIKFYYNARGSLSEAIHWLSLMEERGLVDDKVADALDKKLRELHSALNVFIKGTFGAKKRHEIS